MSSESLKGRLLVATPALGDPNFDRTVVLVLEHNDEGAVGLVLNRPSGVELFDSLARWQDLAADPPVVFVGGPVAPNVAICLARAGGGGPDDGWEPLVGTLGALDLTGDPLAVGDDVDGLRVFSGYSGWGEGQLEDEIDAGAWFVVDALPGDALCDDPDELWRIVLRRQPGYIKLFANFPPDPAMN